MTNNLELWPKITTFSQNCPIRPSLCNNNPLTDCLHIDPTNTISSESFRFQLLANSEFCLIVQKLIKTMLPLVSEPCVLLVNFRHSCSDREFVVISTESIGDNALDRAQLRRQSLQYSPQSQSLFPVHFFHFGKSPLICFPKQTFQFLIAASSQPEISAKPETKEGTSNSVQTTSYGRWFFDQRLGQLSHSEFANLWFQVVKKRAEQKCLEFQATRLVEE